MSTESNAQYQPLKQEGKRASQIIQNAISRASGSGACNWILAAAVLFTVYGTVKYSGITFAQYMPEWLIPDSATTFTFNFFGRDNHRGLNINETSIPQHKLVAGVPVVMKIAFQMKEALAHIKVMYGCSPFKKTMVKWPLKRNVTVEVLLVDGKVLRSWTSDSSGIRSCVDPTVYPDKLEEHNILADRIDMFDDEGRINIRMRIER